MIETREWEDKEFEALRKKFDDDIVAFQDACPHKKFINCEEWWAIGHSTGRRVNVCNRCHKKLNYDEPIRKKVLPEVNWVDKSEAKKNKIEISKVCL